MAVYGEGRAFELVRCDGSEAWLEQRRKGIGGSDVAAIMGLSRWRSPYETWCEKRGLVEPDDISDKPAVYWGNVLEPIVGEEYARRHPDRKVKRLNAVARSIERPWAQASLDYEVKDPELGWGVLEIKTAGLRSADEWEDGVPLFYLTQVAHYMDVTDRGFADVAVLIGGSDYREYRVMRDEGDVEAVRAAVDAFWGSVTDPDGEPPELMGVGRESSALFKRHSEANGELKGVSGVPRAVADYVDAKERADRWKKELDAASNRLKAEIGDADGIESDEFRIKWVRGESNRLDTKRLKADHPEIVERYTVASKRDMGLRYTDKTKKKGK